MQGPFRALKVRTYPVQTMKELNFNLINYAIRFEKWRPVWVNAYRWQTFFKICRAHLKCLGPICGIKLFLELFFHNILKNIIILYSKGEITCIQTIIHHRLIEGLVDDVFHAYVRFWLTLQTLYQLHVWLLRQVRIHSLSILICRCIHSQLDRFWLCGLQIDVMICRANNCWWHNWICWIWRSLLILNPIFYFYTQCFLFLNEIVKIKKQYIGDDPSVCMRICRCL